PVNSSFDTTSTTFIRLPSSSTTIWFSSPKISSLLFIGRLVVIGFGPAVLVADATLVNQSRKAPYFTEPD
ncbi:hypothetical protein A2U01_0107420, partial [Trifolium medium]|nr:hypothetical protein [Trifolium medium]